MRSPSCRPSVISTRLSLCCPISTRCGLRRPRAEIEEDEAARPGVEDRLLGDDQALAEIAPQLDVGVHVRLQPPPGVVELDAHAAGARGVVEIGVDEGDAPVQLLARQIGQRHRRFVADVHQRQLRLVELRLHPDAIEAGDAEQPGARLDGGAFDDVLLDDGAGHRRENGNVLERLAGAGDPIDLVVAQIPQAQALPRGPHQVVGAVGSGGLGRRALAGERGEELLLGWHRGPGCRG